MDVRLTDNASNDGSAELLRNLGYGIFQSREHIRSETGWVQTTLNNQLNLSNTISSTDSPYVLNIENDSYFFRRGFLEEAKAVLNERPDIDFVHLRYWTPIDDHDWIGIPRNLTRFSATRRTNSGIVYHELERRPCDVLWVDVSDVVDKSFAFDEGVDCMLCPKGSELVVGTIRNRDGRYERLLNEHWNTYPSHGWLGRTDTLKFIVERYQPLSERDFSLAARKHCRAVKLYEDAFFSFGWRTRVQASDEIFLRMISYIKKNGCSSINRIGTFINSDDVTIYDEGRSRISVLR